MDVLVAGIAPRVKSNPPTFVPGHWVGCRTTQPQRLGIGT